MLICTSQSVWAPESIRTTEDGGGAAEEGRGEERRVDEVERDVHSWARMKSDDAVDSLSAGCQSIN